MPKAIRHNIKIGNDFCVFREMIYTEIEGHELDICPYCREALEVDDEIYLVMNNNVIFPNKLVHRKCTEDNLENAAKRLRLQYKQALEYAHWFR